MADDDKDPAQLSSIERERKEPRPDFTQPLPPAKLPQSIQSTLDNEEKFWDAMYGGKGPDSTQSNARYAAYASRVRTILVSAQRYVAYTSDIGESFRPVAHPYLVKGAYGVSWAYLVGDVAHEGYKAYARNQTAQAEADNLYQSQNQTQKQDQTQAPPATSKIEGQTAAETAVSAAKDLVRQAPRAVAPIDDYRTVMVQRAIFQSVASMGLPAFTIHSIVRYSGRAFKNAANKNVRTWAPIGLGLAAVPFLPFVFDKPVEEAVEWAFHMGFEAVGKGKGVDAVGETKKDL